MSASKTGLGRGLESLIPTETIRDQLKQADRGQRVEELDPQQIKPNPYQPRKHFDKSKIDELANSLKVHGLLQPVVVVKSGQEYQLISGERRLRAAKQLEWNKIPALVRSEHEQSQLELALTENIQRDDLGPLEVALAYVQLIEEFDQSIEQVSRSSGKAVTTIKNTIRLLNLPKQAKDALNNDEISEGHARQILALKEESDQLELLKLIKRHGWSVRKAEQYAREKKLGGKTEKAIKQTLSETDFTKQLSRRLNTAVKIQHMAKGGRLLIEFKDKDELVRIQDQISKN